MARLIATLVCDDVREEKSGKLTVVGLYNRDLIVTMPEPTPKITFPKICIVQRWESDDKKHDGRLEFHDHEGKIRVSQAFEVKSSPSPAISNLMFHIVGPTLSPGFQKIKTFLDGLPVEEYELEIKTNIVKPPSAG